MTRPRDTVASESVVSTATLADADARAMRDWYVVPDALVARVGIAPRVKLLRDDSTWIAHRSHLPLLGVGYDLSPLRSTDTGRLAALGLRPYQIEGVSFLRARRGALLADMMRLGKTAQIVASHDLADGRILIVGPRAVRSVWVAWCRKVFPEVEVFCVEGTFYDPSKFRTAQIIFAHYEILPAWASLLWLRPGLLVFDEAHMLSNRGSMRSQAAAFLSSQAERVVCATGTPLWNQPAGIYTLLDCMAPAAWGTWREFAERYCDGRPGPHGFVADGVSNVDEFRARIGEIMLRRTWDDVATDLPPTEREIERVPLDDVQLDKIELALWSARTAGARKATIGEIAKLRHLMAVPKIDRTVAHARRVLAAGRPVVIWAWHRRIAEAISSRLGDDALLLTGETYPDKRDALLDTWRAAKPTALVATISVAQVGIDLSHAADAIFAELDFTPATIAQAEMRTFAPSRPMRVTYIAVEHRVERDIVLALKRKLDHAGLLGVPAADATIDILRSAFGVDDGPDLSRLRDALIGEAAR